jgi:hypothetical protein
MDRARKSSYLKAGLLGLAFVSITAGALFAFTRKEQPKPAPPEVPLAPAPVAQVSPVAKPSPVHVARRSPPRKPARAKKKAGSKHSKKKRHR